MILIDKKIYYDTSTVNLSIRIEYVTFLSVANTNNSKLLKSDRKIKLAFPAYWRSRPNFCVRGFTGLESL